MLPRSGMGSLPVSDSGLGMQQIGGGCSADAPMWLASALETGCGEYAPATGEGGTEEEGSAARPRATPASEWMRLLRIVVLLALDGDRGGRRSRAVEALRRLGVDRVL